MGLRCQVRGVEGWMGPRTRGLEQSMLEHKSRLRSSVLEQKRVISGEVTRNQHGGFCLNRASISPVSSRKSQLPHYQVLDPGEIYSVRPQHARVPDYARLCSSIPSLRAYVCSLYGVILYYSFFCLVPLRFSQHSTAEILSLVSLSPKTPEFKH